MKQSINTSTPVGTSFNKDVLEVDGQKLKRLFNAALTWVKNNQQHINSLNVFPVPDGDTGTNMFLTLQSAYQEVSESQDENAGRIIHMIAQGALMGARGNSGVILSQLLRGFARALDEKENMDASLFIKCLTEARNTAYKGVVRPVEGTILTVAKDIASLAETSLMNTNDLVEMLEAIVQEADRSVKRTPDLLPILKQAGVVDSGGIGLFYLFEGMLRYVKKLPLDESVVEKHAQIVPMADLEVLDEAIEPGQDFEVVVDFVPNSPLNVDTLYEDLAKIGTSIQVGEGDNMYRMHIHVPNDKQYIPINYISKIGTVQKVYIENLIEQMKKKGKNSKQNVSLKIKEGQIAVVAVSPGEGISRIFDSLGVAAIIPGGQTMNPSTKEILDSFESLPTNKVIILPNNENIILTAESTKSMSTKKVAVIPSISVPQGLIACLRLDPDGNYESIVKEMNESLQEVETGEITTATRSVQINGVKVKKGDVIALHNGKLVDSTNNLIKASMNLLEKIGAEKKEHITIFYGTGLQEPQMNEIVEKIKDKYNEQEIEVHDGGQPHYQLILSVE